MGKIADLIAKLDAITTDVVDNGLLTIIKKNQAEALDLNTGQLFEGRDAKDQSLGGYANPRYAAFKQTLNPAGVVDLKLTGSFYQGFFANTDQFPVTFGSNDPKSEMLSEKYGQDIFGLNQNKLETFRQDIKPDVQDLFRSFLKL